MSKKAKHGKITYGIIGLGRFGTALAMELAATNDDIIVIDRNEDKIREIREYTQNAFVVNSLDKKSLEETGIGSCDVAVVCIGEHMESSILTTLNLVSLGIPKVIAKACSNEHGVILEKLGAEVVFPERDMGIRLSNRLETEKMLDFVQLSEKLNVTKMIIPSKAVGKSVLDVNLRKHFGINIIAIENDGNIIDLVTPDYIFRENDILFLSGSKESIVKLTNWADK
ncbi:MAG: TrkA family potassium uptake protein [Clostridia bacterium]|nr:TrkA family potassium uptake protein [Clostridia bacterium]